MAPRRQKARSAPNTPPPIVPPTPQTALQLIPQLAVSLVGARRATLLLTRDGRQCRLGATVGTGLTAGQWVGMDSGIAAEVLRNRRPLLLNDLSEGPYLPHPERGYDSQSCMVVPVLEGSALYGAICVADPKGKAAFTQENLQDLCLLAQHAAHSLQVVSSLHTMASLDALTGVQTRRVFEERLSIEVERSRRFGHPFSLVLLSVDNLQRLNEREGRLAGDQILRWVAQTLVGTVRRVDLVARYEGAGFALVLPETGEEESFAVATRLIDGIRDLPPLRPGQPGPSVQASAGIATLPPASSAMELLAQAHRAMQMARADRGSIYHWELGNGLPGRQGYVCRCAHCGRSFAVYRAAQQHSRRYCSKACAAAGRRQPQHERNLAIVQMRESGSSLRDIALQYGISEERVRQICAHG